jgi:hypothetical protein
MGNAWFGIITIPEVMSSLKKVCLGSVEIAH